MERKLAVLILVLVLIAASAPAAEPPPREEPAVETPASETTSADAETQPPAEARSSEAQPLDPCALPRPGEGATWLEWTQHGVQKSVCRTALWFDSLFGKDRVYEERDETFGWIRPSINWDGEEGVEPGLRFRAKVSLPQLDRRLNAFVGRTEDPEEGGASPSFDEQLPATFRDTDEEWLVGLGYAPLRGTRHRFDADTGLKFKHSPELFVQGRFRRQWLFSEIHLMRYKHTVFWETDNGFGTSGRLDFEHLFGADYLLRWRTQGRISQGEDGVKWFSEMTLFQNIGHGYAIAYQADLLGETEAEVPVERLGLRIIYRQPILREWVFLDIRPGIEYRKDEPGAEREFVPVIGAGLELQFGKRP